MARERSDEADRGGSFGQFLLLAGLLAGGLGIGVALAAPPAPGAALARVSGFVMLPLCVAGSVLRGHGAAPIALGHCLDPRPGEPATHPRFVPSDAAG